MGVRQEGRPLLLLLRPVQAKLEEPCHVGGCEPHLSLTELNGDCDALVGAHRQQRDSAQVGAKWVSE